MRTIPASELIINDDGSIFHLHLLPEQLADTVILVATPDVWPSWPSISTRRSATSRTANSIP